MPDFHICPGNGQNPPLARPENSLYSARQAFDRRRKMTGVTMNSDHIVPVKLGTRSYDIVIGEGTLGRSRAPMLSWLQTDPSHRLRFLMVADQAVCDTHAAVLRESLTESGMDVCHIAIPSGESTKSFVQAQLLYDQLVEMQADRRTVVVAIGGGVTGDLAGFVAATYVRGLRVIQVPTTLLAMVDSSVGGKTGINHPKGKNLIGAFHQPSGVVIDTTTLRSLPDRDYRSGLAEVVKYGVILDADFFEWLESHTDDLVRRAPPALNHVVKRSCELKAQVVQEDEFETEGLRAILNYGHTFGHAFEALAGYGTLMHGEAVAIGIVCASRLAEKLGRVTPADTARQAELLSTLGLPTEVPDTLQDRHEEIIGRMMLDKKTQNQQLRFVLPARIGHVETVCDVSPQTAVGCLND
jgi:3-dehydroquinate synthase